MIKNRNFSVFTPGVWQPNVVLSDVSSVLCENTLSMDNKNFMEQEYAAFERAMNEERIYLRVSDYSEICALIGADPIGLDKVIFEELGWHGQAVVDFYALCENIHNSNFRKCESWITKKDYEIVLLLGHFFIRFAFRRTYEALPRVNRFLPGCSP